MSSEQKSVTFDGKIKTSPSDHRQYRVIQLNNGLRAILISDKINIHGKQHNNTFESSTNVATEKLLRSLSMNDDSGNDTSDDEDGCSTISRVKSQPALVSLAQTHGQRKRTCSTSETNAEGQQKARLESASSPSQLQIPMRKRSAQHSKLAAAALCVGVGSFSDPRETEGLAHFLEHVIFMGNEKYPEENGFDVFLKMHGGSNNASTDAERTIFEFDINPERLQDGLDRFAHCFVNPLLSRSSIENELKAVDSEFVQGLQVDSARRLQLLSSIARKSHPFSKFLWGNSTSLKVEPEKHNIDMQAMLKKFYDDYYHASNMTLAICSSESLDILQSIVESCFGVLPAKAKTTPSFASCQEPFDLDVFHQSYYIVPVKDVHHLEITWTLPSIMEHYRVKAVDYVSWLVGHEGTGSIQALLKERGLVLSIVAGNGEAGVEHNSSYSFFTCSANLTDEGSKHVYEVITVIFEYLKMLQDREPLQEIYEEIQAIEVMKFNFEEQDEPIDFVQCLCENLQLYDVEDVLAGQTLLQDYNIDVIRSVQNALTPDRANILIMGRGYASICTEEEKWFQTKYVAKEIPEVWSTKWQDLQLNKDLHLPSPNKFIAKDFQLVQPDMEPTRVPTLIHDSEMGKLWYKHDTAFCLPKVRLYFHLVTAIPYNSVKNAVCADLFLSTFNYQLKEIAYDASVAELSYDIGMGEKGMTLCFDGFNDKLQLLVDVVLDRLCNFKFTSKTFDIIKKVALRSYKNYLLKPAKLVRTLRLSVLQSDHWTSNDKRLACEELTEEDLQAFARHVMSNLKVHGLVQGNITAKDALKYQDGVYRILHFHPLPVDQFPVVIVNRLPSGSSVVRHAGFNHNDANTVLTNYYQVGPGGLHEFTLTQLLVHMMEEPCFDILRTKEQLGYTVYASCRSTFGIIGLSVTVESQANSFTASFIDSRIEAFLSTFKEKLIEQTAETFQQQVSALVLLKQHVDLSLADEADRNFSEIYNETYLFSRLETEVDILCRIAQQDVSEWFEQFQSNSSLYRKLSVQVVGTAQEAAATNHDTKHEDESDGSESETDTEGSSDEDETHSGPHDSLSISPLTVADSTYSHYINDIGRFKASLEKFPVSKIM